MTYPKQYVVDFVVNDSAAGEMPFFLGYCTVSQVDDLKLRLYGDIRAQHELYATDENLAAIDEWCEANPNNAELSRRFAEHAKRNGRFELRIRVKD